MGGSLTWASFPVPSILVVSLFVNKGNYVCPGLEVPKATQLAVRTEGVRAEIAVHDLTIFSRVFAGIEAEQTSL